MSSTSSIDSLRTGRIFLLIQASTSLFLSLLALCVLGWAAALSFAVGAALVAFSFLSIGLTLYWVFHKKSIALLVGVIVFKWPILIYAMIWFMNRYTVDFAAFAAGSMVWLPAGLVWHFIANKE